MQILGADDDSDLEYYRNQLTLYRIHDKRYIFKNHEFWKNFLDCNRTYSNQYRFAGAKYNHGFYFSNTIEGCLSEFYFYHGESLNNFFRNKEIGISHYAQLQKIDKNKIILKCLFDFNGNPYTHTYSDLTSESNVTGVLKGLSIDTPNFEDFNLRSILSPNSGGNILTDFIGAYLSIDAGMTSVHFPSLRALWSDIAKDFNGGLPFSLEYFERKMRTRHGKDIYFETLDADSRKIYASPMTDSFRGNIEYFAKNYFNIVFFNGVNVLTCLKNIEIIESPDFMQIDNPYHKITTEWLDELRLGEAERLGLHPLEAINLGYTTQNTINEKLEINSEEFIDRINNPHKYYPHLMKPGH